MEVKQENQFPYVGGSFLRKNHNLQLGLKKQQVCELPFARNYYFPRRHLKTSDSVILFCYFHMYSILKFSFIFCLPLQDGFVGTQIL